GGTGIVGMWKAFEELQALGLIGSKRPRMVVIQSTGCASLVRAFDRRAKSSEMWENAQTVAAGMRVPQAFADYLILDAVYESGGSCVAVSDAELLGDMRDLAQKEGLFASPEGAATLSGLKQLVGRNWVKPDERVVLFNTGSALKYPELLGD
ncbi:MAG: pyridoxal-phosphate dependent enzyme, partial [Chloroflexi bacterium]|nr:pyridoxal-phosphate dependent enzyme [Chloroflexota bacterium]